MKAIYLEIDSSMGFDSCQDPAHVTDLRDQGEGLRDRVEHSRKHDDDGQDTPRHDLGVVHPQRFGQQLAEEKGSHRQRRSSVRQACRSE